MSILQKHPLPPWTCSEFRLVLRTAWKVCKKGWEFATARSSCPTSRPRPHLPIHTGKLHFYALFVLKNHCAQAPITFHETLQNVCVQHTASQLPGLQNKLKASTHLTLHFLFSRPLRNRTRRQCSLARAPLLAIRLLLRPTWEIPSGSILLMIGIDAIRY